MTRSGPICLTVRFATSRDFAAWLDERAAADDPYSYAVIDRRTARAVGIVTLMEIRPAMRVIEVGHILYSPALQRTPLATEAQYLLARYAFETLGLSPLRMEMRRAQRRRRGARRCATASPTRAFSAST